MNNMKIGTHLIPITNEKHILFPESGITRMNIANYYEKIAPTMVPHMKNKLISMQRFPNGIDQDGFFQKNAAKYFPTWIKRIAVKKQSGGYINYITCNNSATLVYLASQSCITNHIWLSKVDRLNTPDRMIIDLDPSQNDFAQVRHAALIVKQFLEDLKLYPFAMLTGSRGIHIVVPLRRILTFEQVRKFAKNIASTLVARYPKKFTIEMHKKNRGNRIFIDVLRNAFGQTVVAPYSIRAKENAPIATPIFLDEINDSKLTPTKYTIKNIFKRLNSTGDPWANINQYACLLTKAQKDLNLDI